MGWVTIIIKKRTFNFQFHPLKVQTRSNLQSPIIPNVEYQGILSTIKYRVPTHT